MIKILFLVVVFTDGTTRQSSYGSQIQCVKLTRLLNPTLTNAPGLKTSDGKTIRSATWVCK
jgi:hypothetical protein